MPNFDETRNPLKPVAGVKGKPQVARWTKWKDAQSDAASFQSHAEGFFL